MNEALQAAARDLISPEALTETVAYLCSLGEKVSGSDEEEKACDYITGKLREYGYEPVVHRFDSYLSYPRSAALRVGGPDGYDLPCVGVAFGTSTPEGGFTAEVVLVGSGSEAEYEGKDVAGKIVLVTKLPSPGNSVAAAAKGAKGMICMSAGKQRHKMTITPVWGTPEFDQAKDIPRLHLVSISKTDGDRILANLAKGRVEATIVTDVFEGWRSVRLPVAEIKGEEPLFSLVGAHYCSWFDGSTDNITGDACVLELARVLKQFEGKLRHGLRFAWWPGHSHARYSGSTWYADTFWHDLHENAITYFNIDSPGVKGATVYVPRHQMAELSAYNEKTTKDVTGWTTLNSSNAQLALGKRKDKYVSPTRPSRAGDQSFWGVGVTSLAVYSMLTPEDENRDLNVGGSGGAWWWHSEHETFDKYSPEVLSQDARLYATILLGLSTADVLPFDPAAIAGDYLDSLREFEEAAGEHLPIAELTEETRLLKARLEALRASASKQAIDKNESARMNRLFLRISRLLNPVLYQSGSDFHHDPALGSRALPSLSPALTLSKLSNDSDTYRFTRVGLLRRMNRIRHQLRETSRLLAESGY
jgi:Predicted aminopeptidases